MKKEKIVLHQLNRKLILGMLSLMFTISGFGQVIENDSILQKDSISEGEYAFINYEADTIINGAYLSPLYNKLIRLENCDSTRVSILHIGDSHIQADYLTHEVRKKMQLRFGNAGRGLVFPLRVAGTNEPADYRSSSNAGWNISKITNASTSPASGISGITISTSQSGAYLDFTTNNHDDLDYSFNKVTLFHTKDSSQFDCRFTVAPEKFGYLMSALPLEPNDMSTEVVFSHPSNYIRIQAEQTEYGQKSASIYGVLLQNNKPGVFYHNVGINGAHFNDYNNSPLFFGQIKNLQPDLIIISLGTNEGANIKITEAEMMTSVVTMIRKINAASPLSLILLTTPADDYLKKKYKNPYLETVQRALVKTAEAEKIACWDLYSIAGGFGSCTEWRNAGMLHSDGVHFNKQGYTLQGSLLYNALVDSYFRYAAD